MKILVVVLILLLVLSCSDSEPPTQVIELPEPVAKPEPAEPEIVESERVPPERAQYEIPDGIPRGLAEHFIDLQEHMTEFEWHLFLDQANNACDGRTHGLYTSTILNDLSEQALNAIRQLGKEGKLLPGKLNTKRGRIRVAGLAMPEVRRVEFEGNETKVVYLKNDYTIIFELFGTVGKGNFGSGRSVSILSTTDGFDAQNNARVSFLAERIGEAWSEQWHGEFIERFKAGEFDHEPVAVRGIPPEETLVRVRKFFNDRFRVPHIPGDLDLVIIYLDEARNLLTPQHADIIVDFDDAPEATNRQLEAYNHIHSPDAYDCVE